MQVTRKVEFTKEEVEAATRDALCKLAAEVIGYPSGNEKYDVDMCYVYTCYPFTSVEIVAKKETRARKEQDT